MPFIKLKSEENINSANLLIENNKFASSVHCSYYSCFQITMHILCSKLSIDYLKQSEKTKEKGSHECIIDELCKDLNKKDICKRNAYEDNMTNLKYLRKKADYLNIEINEKNAKSAYNKANGILSLLKKEYSL